jgi:hypothetical protein
VVEHASEDFAESDDVGVHGLDFDYLLLHLFAFVVEAVVDFAERAELEEEESEGVAVALVGLVVDEVHGLLVGAVEFGREVVGRADDGHLLGLVAEPHCRPRPHVAHLEVQRLFREEQHVRGLDVAVRHLRPLQVGEHLQHAREEHEHVVLVEGLRAFGQVGLEVGQSLLHLDVPLLEGVDRALLLLQDEAAAVLDDVGVRVAADLGEQLDLLAEDELGLLVVQPHLLHALYAALLVGHLVHDAVSRPDHLPHLETLVELPLAAHELHRFIAHLQFRTIINKQVGRREGGKGGKGDCRQGGKIAKGR